jgi:hypothetical protein
VEQVLFLDEKGRANYVSLEVGEVVEKVFPKVVLPQAWPIGSSLHTCAHPYAIFRLVYRRKVYLPEAGCCSIGVPCFESFRGYSPLNHNYY